MEMSMEINREWPGPRGMVHRVTHMVGDNPRLQQSGHMMWVVGATKGW